MPRWLACVVFGLALIACSSEPAPSPSALTPSALLFPPSSPSQVTATVSSVTPTAPRHTASSTPLPTESNTPTPQSTATTHPTAPQTVTPRKTATVPQASPTTVTVEALAPTTTAMLPPATVTSPPAPLTPTPAPVMPLPPPPMAPQPPRAYETTITIPTYGYEQAFQITQPDDSIYPYPRLDFSRIGPPVPRTYKAVVLENGYVSLTILPDLGGRLYRWIDKATGRQLLYNNPVVKPTSWGYRGWWVAAGGIEWAFPVEEHGLNEWRPWSYSTGYSANGLSVTVSDVDDHTGMEVGATMSLDADHAYVTLQPWARNHTDQAQLYQLWLNAMLTLGANAVSGETRIILPTDQVTVHSSGDGGLPGSGAAMGWPIHGGRDMSWYANWGAYLGFFAPVASAGYAGLYDHAADQGFVRAHAPGWPAGTKIFGPAGLSPSTWTDGGSNYIELWSGATGSFWSYATLDPGQSVGWTERWYPVSGMGGYNMANQSAALRLTDTGGGAEVGVAVSAYTTGSLCLWADGQLVDSWSVALYPGQAFRANWTRPADVSGALGLRLEDGSGGVIAQTGLVP